MIEDDREWMSREGCSWEGKKGDAPTHTWGIRKCYQLSQPPNDQFQGEEGGAGRGSNVEAVKIRKKSRKVKEKDEEDREGADGLTHD